MNMTLDREIIEEIDDGTVYLRKTSEKDAQFLYKSLKNKEIIKYMSLSSLPSLNHAKTLIERQQTYWDKYRQFNYIIKVKDGPIIHPIGAISLWNLDWHNNRGEIGIWIIPSFWNEGFGKKAIKLGKIIAFMHLKFNRLEAHIVSKNMRSLNLFLKSGFDKEGHLKQYLNLEGRYYDVYIVATLLEGF